MKPARFVDQWLDVHRYRDGLGEATSVRAGFSGLQNLGGFGKSGMDLDEAGDSGIVEKRFGHLWSPCTGDSDAPISSAVERIRSNLMAQIEAAGELIVHREDSLSDDGWSYCQPQTP